MIIGVVGSKSTVEQLEALTAVLKLRIDGIHADASAEVAPEERENELTAYNALRRTLIFINDGIHTDGADLEVWSVLVTSLCGSVGIELIHIGEEHCDHEGCTCSQSCEKGEDNVISFPVDRKVH